MKNRIAYRYITRIVQKKTAYLRRFWMKEPRGSRNIFAKKRYTSIIVACVWLFHWGAPSNQKQLFGPRIRSEVGGFLLEAFFTIARSHSREWGPCSFAIALDFRAALIVGGTASSTCYHCLSTLPTLEVLRYTFFWRIFFLNDGASEPEIVGIDVLRYTFFWRKYFLKWRGSLTYSYNHRKM